MKRCDIRALAEQAYAILDDSESEAAVERALQVLVNAPKDPESYLLMSEIVGEMRHFDQALAWIDRGLKQHPQHEGLLLKKASILIDGFEDIDEAFRLLLDIKAGFGNKSLAELKRALGPSLLLDIYLLLVDCYRLKSDYRQAHAHALLARDCAPFDESSLIALATSEFEMGNYRQALNMIEPIDTRTEASDFYWLKAQINCAEGNFLAADDGFLKANKIDKARYHRPIRLNEACFLAAFEQGLLGLPREIREFVQSNAAEIHDIVPLDMVKSSHGTLSPTACIAIDATKEHVKGHVNIIAIFQKNLENLASKKEEVKDLIASALLHELGKLIARR